MPTLKKFLFDRYGGFEDKRIKDLARDERFVIDDRNQGDRDARGRLYYWFCTLHASVADLEDIKITLGNAPIGMEVQNWVENNKATLTKSRSSDAKSITFTMKPDGVQKLRSLAQAFDILARTWSSYGKDKKHYYYVCPRTAESLRGFAVALDDYRKENPHIPARE
jgi:hypothetical protein